MNAKDILSMQEAYNQIYQVDEAEKWIQKAIKKPGALSKQLGVPEDENIPAEKLAAAAKKGGKLGKRARLAMTLKGLRREEIDLYDIVFTHLLDEGYAETEEAAHKIMVNMSEEWRESIVEARKKVKIDTQKPIEYKIADIGPGKKEYNVKTSKGWKEEVEPDPFGRPGGKHGGVRKGGGYEKGYEAMKKKIKELEDKK